MTSCYFSNFDYTIACQREAPVEQRENSFRRTERKFLPLLLKQWMSQDEFTDR